MVIEVAGLLGTGVERINCSSDTTTEQLFGSVVPQYNDNQRTFEWMDGKLIEAIKEGRWILLDEINLLPPQVLESLVPLLNGSTADHGLVIPGQSGANKPMMVKDIYIFATMNPAAEGGGRTKLSRSIRNLFTAVELDPQSNDELFEILRKLFRDRISQDVVSEDSIHRLFDVFTKVQSLVEMGEIKIASRRQRFNLRDLVAVRDIVAGNVYDQLSHYKIVATSSSREELSKEDKASVIDSVLRNALQLVFKHRFESQAAQECIQNAIDDVIKPPKLLINEENSTSIDTSVNNLVRIGRVYLNKNPNRASNGSLVHTKETVEQLELLAAASQSTRTVLLEGPTCSRKTCLVKELAVLTGRPLLLLSLHREYEVSDLIGQWLPARTDSIHGEVLQELLHLRNRIVKTGLEFCEHASKDKQTAFYRVMKKARSSNLSQDRTKDRQIYRFNLEICRELIQRLTAAVEVLEDTDQQFHSSFRNELQALSGKLSMLLDGEETVVFRFVTSDLVKALKSGTFILFDNINAAPPEVIERVLSLFEEEPFLNLYEHAEGEQLSRKDGIHPDTRLFATADLGRINTHKLSNPLLNRMIKIWLPEIDSWISDATFESLEEHEVVEILSEKFASHAGGNMAARLLSFVHARVKGFTKNCEITISKDSGISFRTLLEASSLVTSLLKNDQPVFNAVVWGAWRIYASVLEDEADWRKLKEVIQSACEATAEVPPSKFYAIRQKRDAVEPFLAESENIRLVFASVVHISLKILFGCIMKILDMDVFERLVLLFLNQIAVKLYPREETMIRHLIQEVPKGARNEAVLKHQCEVFGCDCVKEFFKAVTHSEMQKVDYVCKHPRKLLSLCEQLVANSAYSDWQNRRFMIQDISVVLQEITNLLEAVPLRPSQSSDIQKVMEVVRQWRAVEDLFIYFDPLEDASFASCYQRLLQARNECSDTAVSYTLEKLLSEKVSSSDMKLRHVIVNLLKNDGHPVEERRWVALQLAMTSLRWRTMLMLDEHLLTIHPDTETTGQILALQKLLCQSNMIANLQEVVHQYLETFKAAKKERGIIQQTKQFFEKLMWPFHGQGYHRLVEESEENIAADDDNAIPDEMRLIKQLDELMRTDDAVFLFSDEWVAIVEFHAKLLNELSLRREREGNPLSLDTAFFAWLGSRMDDARSQHRCANELSLIWLGVCFSEWRNPIPCQIILCTEENITFDPFRGKESSISAVILCAELSSRQGTPALVSLVVFEKAASNDGERTALTVQHHRRGQGEISQNTWLERWMKYHTEYVIVFLGINQLPETKMIAEPLSRLGNCLMDCLAKLQSYDYNFSSPDVATAETVDAWKVLIEETNKTSKEEDIFQASLLYHGILKLDFVLCRLQHGGSEQESDMFSIYNDFLSNQSMSQIKAEINESVVAIKNLATRGGRESASIAYSFLKQFEGLKRFPSEDLAQRASEVERAIQAIYKDLFFVLNLIRPILGLREFLIEYSLGHLDPTDPDLWTKCNAVTTFVSGSIVYFNAFLIVDGEKTVLDRERTEEEFEDWQDSFKALIDQLNISMTILEANSFDKIFLQLRDRYFDFLQTEAMDKIHPDSFKGGKDASASSCGPMSENGSDNERLINVVSDLIAGYEDLWIRARESTNKAVMDDAAASLNTLRARDNSSEISKAVLAKYQSQLSNLNAELNQSASEKEDARHFPVVSKECDVFVRNLAICLQNCDFSFVPLRISPADDPVRNPHKDFICRVADCTDRAKKSIQILTRMAKNTAFHARLQKSIDVLRRYDFEDSCANKREVLEELSDLGIFHGPLSIRLKFRASDSDSCNELVQAAVVELLNVKADFILKQQKKMFQPIYIEEVENAVNDITHLSTVDDSCPMFMADPVFDTLRRLSKNLSSCLDESAVMANVASSFVCPGLSVEDIVVLFCANFNRIQHTLMDYRADRNLDIASDDPIRHMRRRGRLVSYAYQRDAEVTFIFADIVEIIEKAVVSILTFNWESELASQSDVCKKATKEIVIGLQFIALSVLLTKQDFSFLSSFLLLSDSVEEQKNVDRLKNEHQNVTAKLEAKTNELKEVREGGGLFDPVSNPGTVARNPQPCYNAHHLSIEREIDELETLKIKVEKQMMEAESQLQPRRIEICRQLSSDLRILLLTGLRCLSRIFRYDTKHFESYLETNSESAAHYALFIKNATKASTTIFRDMAGINPDLVVNLEQCCQTLDKFKKERLSCLNTGDPFCNALQSLCTVASLGARRIMQLISPNIVQESTDMQAIASLEKRSADGFDALSNACIGHPIDEDTIKKASEDVLKIQEDLRRLRGDNAQNKALSSALEYAENTVQRVVGYYNAHVDAQNPVIWYRNAIKDGRLPPLCSVENSSFQQDLDRLPSLWKSCFDAIRSAIDTSALTNPFQLLSLMENYCTRTQGEYVRPQILPGCCTRYTPACCSTTASRTGHRPPLTPRPPPLRTESQQHQYPEARPLDRTEIHLREC